MRDLLNKDITDIVWNDYCVLSSKTTNKIINQSVIATWVIDRELVEDYYSHLSQHLGYMAKNWADFRRAGGESYMNSTRPSIKSYSRCRASPVDESCFASMHRASGSPPSAESPPECFFTVSTWLQAGEESENSEGSG